MSEWKARRFWKEVRVDRSEEGFAILLDDRPVNTPAGAPLALPTSALAKRIAEEWVEQDELIVPESMPVTRAANSAIDKIRPNHGDVVSMVAAYGETDLVCYRAEGPKELLDRQADAWDDVLHWAEADLRAPLSVTHGILPVPQPEGSLRKLRSCLDDFSAFELVAVADLVTLSGSLLIGLAVARQRWDPLDLWERSRVDELWQIEQWGEDAEAATAVEAKRLAFVQAADFYQMAQG